MSNEAKTDGQDQKHILIIKSLNLLASAVDRLEAISNRIDSGTPPKSLEDRKPDYGGVSLNAMLATTAPETAKQTERIQNLCSRLEELLF